MVSQKTGDVCSGYWHRWHARRKVGPMNECMEKHTCCIDFLYHGRILIDSKGFYKTPFKIYKK